MNDIPDIVKAVCLHTTVLSMKAELDQIAEGLEIFDIINLVRDHPSLMQPLFVLNPVDAQLTVDKITPLLILTSHTPLRDLQSEQLKRQHSCIGMSFCMTFQMDN